MPSQFKVVLFSNGKWWRRRLCNHWKACLHSCYHAKRESDIPCMSSPLQKHEDLLLALARNIVEFLC